MPNPAKTVGGGAAIFLFMVAAWVVGKFILGVMAVIVMLGVCALAFIIFAWLACFIFDNFGHLDRDRPPRISGNRSFSHVNSRSPKAETNTERSSLPPPRALQV